jgi:hypothetical protein
MNIIFNDIEIEIPDKPTISYEELAKLHFGKAKDPIPFLRIVYRTTLNKVGGRVGTMNRGKVIELEPDMVFSSRRIAFIKF